MRASFLRGISTALVAAAAFGAPAAHAQSPAARPELALAYDYARSNAPTGSCGCFSLNGGSATFALPLHHAGLSFVADIASTHAGNVSSSGLDLTLTTYAGGARYTLPRTPLRLRPFGQVLVAVAHANGSLIHGSTISNSSAAFASLVGGGIDLHLTHRLSARLIEADYLVTTFNNGSNDHQNILRLSTGLVLHF